MSVGVCYPDEMWIWIVLAEGKPGYILKDHDAYFGWKVEKPETSAWSTACFDKLVFCYGVYVASPCTVAPKGKIRLYINDQFS